MSEQVTRQCDFRVQEKRKYRACGERVPDDAPTVFSIGEKAYKGDLCANHQLLLEEVLAPFIEISEGYIQVGKAVRHLLQVGKGRVSQADMRAWLVENTDLDIAPTGALKKEAIDVYNAAHA